MYDVVLKDWGLYLRHAKSLRDSNRQHTTHFDETKGRLTVKMYFADRLRSVLFTIDIAEQLLPLQGFRSSFSSCVADCR